MFIHVFSPSTAFNPLSEYSSSLHALDTHTLTRLRSRTFYDPQNCPSPCYLPRVSPTTRYPYSYFLVAQNTTALVPANPSRREESGMSRLCQVDSRASSLCAESSYPLPRVVHPALQHIYWRNSGPSFEPSAVPSTTPVPRALADSCFGPDVSYSVQPTTYTYLEGWNHLRRTTCH